MILSHRHEFLFIKTAKTAGSSIEIALSRFCGPDDVITPLTPKDDRLRRSLGVRGPQNHRKPLFDYELKDWKRLFAERRPAPRFYNHMPASEVIGLVPESVWRDYYKFCVVRNPWDSVVSNYFWRLQHAPRPSVSEYLNSHLNSNLIVGSWIAYTMANRVVMDRVCRYETLKEDLKSVTDHLGLPELELPRAKSGTRPPNTDYRTVLSPHDIVEIGKLFAREIEHFGYTP